MIQLSEIRAVRCRTFIVTALTVGLGLSVPARASTFGLAEETSINAFGPTGALAQALYDSTQFSGALGNNVGLFTDFADPTAALSTNPQALTPGIVKNVAMNLTSEGSVVNVSGGLSTGATHIFMTSVDGPPNETEDIGAITLQDGLTFHVPGGGSAMIGLKVTADGSVKLGDSSGNYTQTVFADLAGADFEWVGASNASNGGSQSTNVVPNTLWVPNSIVQTSDPTDLTFFGLVSVADGTDEGFQIRQMINCNTGASCDFSKTLQFSLVLPPGVTFTSDSGTFLSNAPSSTVPEPGTIALTGSMLAVLCFAGRRRLKARD